MSHAKAKRERQAKRAAIKIATDIIEGKKAPRNHKLFWGSSYDRGLDILLKLWPQIKEKFIDATLDICYGWNLFDAGYGNNPERMAWKERVNQMMTAPGITHHGRIPQNKLKEIREQCGIWAYPTYFQEINCITALECQRDGCVPVTIDNFALSETVQSGRKVQGDIYDPETQEKWLYCLFELMSNEEVWKEEQLKGQKFAEEFSWDRIAKKWEANFE